MKRRLDAHEGIGVRWQIAVFLLVLFAIFTRRPGAFLHPQFFAEDGKLWFQDAYNLHWLRSLGIPVVGYFQTLPRLISSLALLFPLLWAPLVMSTAGAILQALPVTALLSRRCSTWGPLSMRILMAAAYIGIADSAELHIVTTDAEWHLALLMVLLAFSLPPIGRLGRLVDLVVFAIGSVSGPFCLLLWLSVLPYWWVRRRRWTLVLFGLLSIGAAIQAYSLMHNVRYTAGPLGPSINFLARIVGGDVFINSMIGTALQPQLPLAMFWAATLAGLPILIWGWRSAPLPIRLYMCFALLAFVAALYDPMIAAVPTRWKALASTDFGCRYWFYPSLAFVWAALWCAARGPHRWVRYAGLSVLLITAVGDARVWVYPTWPDNHFSTYVQRFENAPSGAHVVIPLYPPGWKMTLIKR